MNNNLTPSELLMKSITASHGHSPDVVQALADALWKAEKYEKIKTEIEDWKELFYLLKSDHSLLENFQTNEWMTKARNMNIEI
ncbi:hypothetical protein [Sporosarcina sp. FSL W7-1283]|uniref:hypothetical protein n=1 Tax=Sporosarcina sp. FSL W7-1283 TaxID=2921560 RepID=UPI0030F677BE